MKRFLRSIGQTFAIGGLNIGIFLNALYVVLILLYVFFNFMPYHLSSGSGFGLLDFEKGVPVNVSFHKMKIPDLNIHFKSPNGENEYKVYHSSRDENDIVPGLVAGSTAADTISTRYRYFAHAGAYQNEITMTAVSLDKGMVNIQTKNKGLRLLFLAPYLLSAIIIVVCLWQMSRLLASISKGISFANVNLKRLQNVGWLIVAYQVVLFFLSHYSYFYFIADFHSSIPHYRSPLTLNASPDYEFSINWLIIGMSILIVSASFKKGIQLQQEHDLTI